MMKAIKELKIYDVTNLSDWDNLRWRRVTRAKARNDIWDEDYYSWVYRSTFHKSATRYWLDTQYYFENNYSFS